jgi:hypothetical protein
LSSKGPNLLAIDMTDKADGRIKFMDESESTTASSEDDEEEPLHPSKDGRKTVLTQGPLGPLGPLGPFAYLGPLVPLGPLGLLGPICPLGRFGPLGTLGHTRSSRSF